jgi:cell wall-associated NlpC family hydrolase
MGQIPLFNYSDLMFSPFVDGGRDVLTGLDCWGLLMEVSRRMGHEIPDFRVSCFASADTDERVREESPRLATRVDAPEPGAVVAMAMELLLPHAVQHFGVMVDNRRFLHTLECKGPLLTKIDDGYFCKRIKGFYTWKR